MKRLRNLLLTLACLQMLASRSSAVEADWTCANHGGTSTYSAYCTPSINAQTDTTTVRCSYPGTYYYSAAGKAAGGSCTYVWSGNVTITSGYVEASFPWTGSNAVYGSMFMYYWQTGVGGQAWLAKTGYCSIQTTCY